MLETVLVLVALLALLEAVVIGILSVGLLRLWGASMKRTAYFERKLFKVERNVEELDDGFSELSDLLSIKGERK